MKQFIHTYDSTITIEKLLKAWQQFVRDKKNKKDVILFQAKLMDNIFDLFNDLKNKLYKHFNSKFNHDPYSCRLNKGTHKAINRFRDFFRKVSKNHAKTCFVLKCDIKKFFANIDHQILKQ